MYFSEVIVYEFPITIGDNPSCSHGCPIALNYKSGSISVYNEDFDLFDDLRHKQRRRNRDLALPPDARTRMLMDVGFHFEEVVEGTAEVIRAQELRIESLQTTKWEDFRTFVDKKRNILLQLQKLNMVRPSIKKAATRTKNAKSA